MSANEILGVVTALLAVISTYAGAKWQNALNKADAATSTATDLTAQLNNVIIAAKDGQVDETAFQKIVNDAQAFLKDL